jgi:hypothetical protein
VKNGHKKRLREEAFGQDLFIGPERLRTIPALIIMPYEPEKSSEFRVFGYVLAF